MKVLYKYVSAANALKCIPEVGDGALRATQPSALNDPFECSVLKIFNIPRTSHDKTVAENLTKINPATPITEREVTRARERSPTLFWQELLRQQVSHRFGVVSFASEPRHPLLWAHYTVDGSGFSIGYDIAMLSKLTQGNERLEPVEYRQQRPSIIGYEVLPNQDNVYNILLKKSSYWCYEKEWRLVVELNHTSETEKIDAHGIPIYLIRVPNVAVKKIYYTERTPAEIVHTIESRIRDAYNGYGVHKLVKMVLSDTTYDYEEEARN